MALGQTPAQEQFFESKVRPVLANRCYSCHTSAQSGGLRLDSREAALKGGKSGPALVPGKPEDSLLIKATSYRHEKLRMPPAERLEDSEIDGLTQWVKDGAIWPVSSAPDLRAAKSILVISTFHATILHLMGMDHKRLTYRHAGRDFRLTDVHGEVVDKILA